jgi:hypothetical protein
VNNEQAIKQAISVVLSNVGNYPRDVQARLLGANLSKVIGEATEAVMKTGLVEQVDKVAEKPDVTRVELIVNSQRDRIIYGATGVATALQDEGKTLKVFLLDQTKHTVLHSGDMVLHKDHKNFRGAVYDDNHGHDYTRVLWQGDEYPQYTNTDDLLVDSLDFRCDDPVELEVADEDYAHVPVGTKGRIIDWWKDRDEVLVEFEMDAEDCDVILNKKLLRRL